jgi:threonine synthase
MPTLSPSMDIQVSSNFERALFEVCGRDAAKVRGWMADLARTGSFTLDEPTLGKLREAFRTTSLDDDETLATIRGVHARTGVLVDPHTAVGLGGLTRLPRVAGVSTVVLATAHPAKFPDAVVRATGVHPPLPPHLADLFEREERCDVLPADAGALVAYLREHARVATPTTKEGGR